MTESTTLERRLERYRQSVRTMGPADPTAEPAPIVDRPALALALAVGFLTGAPSPAQAATKTYPVVVNDNGLRVRERPTTAWIGTRRGAAWWRWAKG